MCGLWQDGHSALSNGNDILVCRAGVLCQGGCDACENSKADTTDPPSILVDLCLAGASDLLFPFLKTGTNLGSDEAEDLFDACVWLWGLSVSIVLDLQEVFSLGEGSHGEHSKKDVESAAQVESSGAQGFAFVGVHSTLSGSDAGVDVSEYGIGGVGGARHGGLDKGRDSLAGATDQTGGSGLVSEAAQRSVREGRRVRSVRDGRGGFGSWPWGWGRVGGVGGRHDLSGVVLVGTVIRLKVVVLVR